MALPCCGWNKCRWTTATILVAIVAVLWYLMYGCCDSKRFDPKNIAGKRVVICGASSGIGAELAYEYARLGARIVLGARREEKLRSVTDKCKELGAQSCDYVLVDYSSFDSSRNFYEETLGRTSVVSSTSGTTSGAPDFAMYSVSKHAIHGFFEMLDFEMRFLGQSNVSMTICILGPIDTEASIKIGHEMKVDGSMFWNIRNTADETTRRIIEATEARQLQLFHPLWIYLVKSMYALDLRIYYRGISAILHN